MQGKVIVFVLTSGPARVAIYRHLTSLGAILVVVQPNRLREEFDGVFDYWFQHDTSDTKELARALTTYLANLHLKADAVVSFDEFGVYCSTLLAQEMGFQSVPLPPEMMRVVSCKHLFRLYCAEHGISQPKVAALHTPKKGQDGFDGSASWDLPAYVRGRLEKQGLQYPLVVKPSSGAGSLLVRLCENEEELVSFIRLMWGEMPEHEDLKYYDVLYRDQRQNGTDVAEMEPRKGHGDARWLHEKEVEEKTETGAETDVTEFSEVVVLVEEYISGQEVDLDCIIERGKVMFCAISDNDTPIPPYFQERGGVCPSVLPPSIQQQLRAMMGDYVASYGDKLHGVLHAEAKYDFERQRPFIIEVNCRPGGAEVCSMIRGAYHGVELGEAVVRCALQLPIAEQLARHFPQVRLNTPRAPCRIGFEGPCREDAMMGVPGKEVGIDGVYPHGCYCASVNVYPIREGLITELGVPPDEDLYDLSFGVSVGMHVALPPKFFKLVVWLVARGATAEAARENLDRSTQRVVQRVAEVPEISAS